jgi:hypothetical protein
VHPRRRQGGWTRIFVPTATRTSQVRSGVLFGWGQARGVLRKEFPTAFVWCKLRRGSPGAHISGIPARPVVTMYVGIGLTALLVLVHLSRLDQSKELKLNFESRCSQFRQKLVGDSPHGSPLLVSLEAMVFSLEIMRVS